MFSVLHLILLFYQHPTSCSRLMFTSRTSARSEIQETARVGVGQKSFSRGWLGPKKAFRPTYFARCREWISSLLETVIIGNCDSNVSNYLLDSGCTLSDLISEAMDEAINHGQFVSSVAAITRELKRDGVISGREKGAIQRCAVRKN